MNVEILYKQARKSIIDSRDFDIINTIPYGSGISIEAKHTHNAQVSKKFISDIEALDKCYKNISDIKFLNHAKKHFSTHVSMFAERVLNSL